MTIFVPNFGGQLVRRPHSRRRPGFDPGVEHKNLDRGGNALTVAFSPFFGHDCRMQYTLRLTEMLQKKWGF